MVAIYEKLGGGDYKNSSYLAAIQRTLNYYLEEVPTNSDEPFPFIHQPTPGLTSLHPAPPSQTGCRGLYRDTQTLKLWGVWDQNLYYIDSSFQFHLVGVLTSTIIQNSVPRSNRVTMTNNQQYLIISDNSGGPTVIGDGWTVNLTTLAFAKIDSAGASPGWLGSPILDYLDTFILASRPGTPLWYISDSNSPTWSNADLFASKTAVADNIVGIGTTSRYIWLFGELSTEIWNASFSVSITNNYPYQPVLNVVYAEGCAAVYSIAKLDDEIFFLGKDQGGRGVIYQTQGNSTRRISTHAIENEIQQYPTISDAEGYCYQQNGHVFYVLTFPSANNDLGATWSYDTELNAWHERSSIDENGLEWRHKVRMAVDAYGKIVCGDWFTNDLYFFDLNNPTDNGQTIIRERSMPHIVDLNNNSRIRYVKLNVSMQPGLPTNQISQPAENIVECSFQAANGTLLQNYFNPNDIGATFTHISGSTNEEIVNGAATGVGSGNALYRPIGQPDVNNPNYFLRYNSNLSVNSNNLLITGNNVFAIGRADGSNNGYKAEIIAINASNLAANLEVMGHQIISVPMGPVNSHGYYQVILDMQSTQINMSVYRSNDSTWLLPTATWSPVQSPAISIVDTTFTNAGNIFIGGSWA